MNNSQMVANRFLSWQSHKRALAFIVTCANAGRTVYISNALYSIKINAKTCNMVKATKTGLYVLQGKRGWQCVNGSKISAQ